MTAPRMSAELRERVRRWMKGDGTISIPDTINELWAALAAAEKERDAWRREALAWRELEDARNDHVNWGRAFKAHTQLDSIRAENEAAGPK